MMQRPGNAGSFTAADHLAVLKASFAQISAQWRTDVLVSIDGAGASHEVIEHLSQLNTAPEHGKRGRPTSKTGSSNSKPAAARNLPAIDYGRNAAWLQLAALATSLTA